MSRTPGWRGPVWIGSGETPNSSFIYINCSYAYFQCTFLCVPHPFLQGAGAALRGPDQRAPEWFVRREGAVSVFEDGLWAEEEGRMGWSGRENEEWVEHNKRGAWDVQIFAQSPLVRALLFRRTSVWRRRTLSSVKIWSRSELNVKSCKEIWIRSDFRRTPSSVILRKKDKGKDSWWPSSHSRLENNACNWEPHSESLKRYSWRNWRASTRTWRTATMSWIFSWRPRPRSHWRGKFQLSRAWSSPVIRNEESFVNSSGRVWRVIRNGWINKGLKRFFGKIISERQWCDLCR